MPRFLNSTTLSVFLLSSALYPAGPLHAQGLAADTLPRGGVVTGGAAQLDYETPAELHVRQSSDRAVIDWESFHIGREALTQFHQPGAHSIAVNRVTGAGADPTQILGTLKANGTVMVLDRNGVIFGRGSVVDVGGIIASTGSIDTDRFMSGAPQVEITDINPGGVIVNEGTITVADAGLAAFVAPTIVNAGIIRAKAGRVELAAGTRATLDLYGDGLVELAVEEEALSQTILNTGLIEAQGGQVHLSAAAAKTLVDNLILNSGVVRATAIGRDEAGQIVLMAEGGGVINSGVLDASGRQEGQRGGQIEVLGDHISLLEGTVIDASGHSAPANDVILSASSNVIPSEVEGSDPLADNEDLSTAPPAAASVEMTNEEDAGGTATMTADKQVRSEEDFMAHENRAGGSIKVGGDYLGRGETQTAQTLYVDKNALTLNDAIERGDAGRTIFWSDDTTEFNGLVLSRGGINGGNGGFLETSGKINLLANGFADLGVRYDPTTAVTPAPSSVILSDSEGSHETDGDPSVAALLQDDNLVNPYQKGTYLLDPADITIYGNVDPAFVSTDTTVNLAADLQLWLDAADDTQVTLTYSTDSLGGATAGGTIGTNTITTSADVSANLEVGARIRLGAAGAVTTADTLGSDTYTITNIAGTTITVQETLTTTHAADTLRRGLVSQLSDKSGNNTNHATQSTESEMPIWVKNRFGNVSSLVYDGTDDQLIVADDSSLSFTDNTFQMFITANSDDPNAEQGLLGKRSSWEYSIWKESPGGGNLIFTSWNLGGADVYADIMLTNLDSNNSIYSWGANGVKADLYNNGFFHGFVNKSANSLADGNQPLIIGFGGNAAPDGYWNGTISDIIFYADDLPTEQRQLIEQYQSAKWGIALTPPGTGGTEAAKAMASDGYGVFTTRYLERLSSSADIVLAATNTITLDLKGDTLSLDNDRSISLTTTNGDITDVSAGTIRATRTGSGGNISMTAGGAGNIDLDTTNLEALSGGLVNLDAGGDVTLTQTSALNLGTVQGTNVSLESTGNIGGSGGVISDGGTIDVTAGGDLDFSTIGLRSGGGDITLDGGNDVRLNTSVNAGSGAVSVTAGQDIFVTPHDLTAGLVGHWDFDEGAGTAAADSSGNGNDGTLQNGPIWSADTPFGLGNSLNFDGADDYVEIIDHSSLDLPNTVTGSAWIKVNNDNSAYQILRKKPDGGDSVINFNKTSGNKLQVYISGGDGTWIQGESTNLITADNAWHNVAFSYQANAADSLKIYIDGVGETVVLTGTNPLSQIKTSNQPLHIGSFGGTSTYFDGLIDDVRIYNTALSASDIALLASPFGQIDPVWTSSITTFNAGGDVTLGGAVSGSDAGNAITMVAEGNFVNNAGAGALNAPNGRWLVYSADPDTITPNGLSPAFERYSTTFAGTPPASISQSGNGFIYSAAAPPASLTLPSVYEYNASGNIALSGGTAPRSPSVFLSSEEERGDPEEEGLGSPWGESEEGTSGPDENGNCLVINGVTGGCFVGL